MVILVVPHEFLGSTGEIVHLGTTLNVVRCVQPGALYENRSLRQREEPFLAFLACGFGVFLLLNSFWASHLRATVQPDALHLVAHHGRHPLLTRGISEAVIPWSDIQGFTSRRILNPSGRGGSQTTYILYTARGDFTLNDMQWARLDVLMSEISTRTGRSLGTVSPERAYAHAAVQTTERHMYSVQRIIGWIALAVCAPLLFLVLLAGMIEGLSADLATASIFLFVVAGLGLSMIRFYRK